MSRTANVVRLTLPPGRRVLVISDIHGNLPFFRGVLSAARYTPDDVLVLLGDLVARNVVAPVVLPIGAITSFLGGPLFLYLLFRGGRQA